jgi:hypothetical protein
MYQNLNQEHFDANVDIQFDWESGPGREYGVGAFDFGRDHSATGFACHLVTPTCGHHGVPSYQNPDLLGKERLQLQHS